MKRKETRDYSGEIVIGEKAISLGSGFKTENRSERSTQGGGDDGNKFIFYVINSEGIIVRYHNNL